MNKKNVLDLIWNIIFVLFFSSSIIILLIYAIYI